MCPWAREWNQLVDAAPDVPPAPTRGRVTGVDVAAAVRLHPGERVTVAKLRWLLGKATAALGELRLADLSTEQVCAWRLTVPEGHRFEATQALRQVLNRAVAWKLIDENPAKRGVPNPGRRCRSSGRSSPGSRSGRGSVRFSV